MTPADALNRCTRDLHPAKLYTAAQAAAALGLDVANVHRAIEEGRLEVREARPRRSYGFQVIRFAERRAAAVEPHSGVIAISPSLNAKLGGCAVTIVARQSCPTSCAFHESGCYAEHDNNRIWWDRITAGAPDATPLDLARVEADAIDGLPADRDLRLHVAGDSVTVEGTQFLAAACERYVERGKVPLTPTTTRPVGRPMRDTIAGPTRRPAVFAYTHGWRLVPRSAWGSVSILASCETADDVRAAHARGYAAALVVPAFETASAYTVGASADGTGGVRIVPCPQQTRDRTCAACRLCMDAPRLLERGLAIGFALHGWGSNKAAAALRRVALPMAS